MAVDLLHEIERHADRDQKTGATVNLATRAGTPRAPPTIVGITGDGSRRKRRRPRR